MSKAKELARELQVSGQLFTSSDFMKLTNELCDAVLSEPEPSTLIAELEAEVERLKAFCNEWVHNEEAFQKESAVEICPIITQEGEG